MKRPVDVSEPRKTERRRGARPNPTASAKRKSRLLSTFSFLDRGSTSPNHACFFEIVRLNFFYLKSPLFRLLTAAVGYAIIN